MLLQMFCSSRHVVTLVTRVSYTFMFGLFMLLQMTGSNGSVVTLVTRVYYTLTFGFFMMLQSTWSSGSVVTMLGFFMTFRSLEVVATWSHWLQGYLTHLWLDSSKVGSLTTRPFEKLWLPTYQVTNKKKEGSQGFKHPKMLWGTSDLLYNCWGIVTSKRTWLLT